MTESEEKLLIRSLLRYYQFGVKCEVDYLDEPMELEGIRGTNTFIFGDGVYERYLSQFKPYLRPIFDMTPQECDKLFEILEIDERNGEWIKINDIGIIRLFTEPGKDFEDIDKGLEYLDSIFIDYRGLIPKGLALEAKDGIYNIER